MRAALFCALALLAAGALNAASPPPADPAAHAKASSFEPHSGSHSRVYGAPIQQRIPQEPTETAAQDQPEPAAQGQPTARDAGSVARRLHQLPGFFQRTVSPACRPSFAA